jgi:hypothetical protein
MDPRENDASNLELGHTIATSSRLLRSLATDAAAAVAALWDPTRKSFWRSTEHRSSEESKATGSMFFPTVTFRSLEALLRLIEEHPEWADSTITDLALTQAVPALLAHKEEDIRSSLGVSTEGDVLNPFTLSLYIDCLARVCGCTRIGATLEQDALKKLEKACEHVLAYSSVAKQSSHVGAAAHPLVLFHVMRAIEAAMPRLPRGNTYEHLGQFRDSLAEILKQQVKGLLAQDGLGVINPGEGVAVAFCTAALAASQEPEKVAFVQAALRVAFKFQDSSGCWPLGRIVRENQDSEVKRDLQIPTYEITWALAEAVLSLVESSEDFPQDNSTNVAFAKLVKATTYTASSAVQLDIYRKPTRGWCSEHAFGKPTIESWTSATVLQSILSVYRLAEAIDRRLVLRNFASASPSDADWPKWQRWAKYKSESEPEQDVRILEYVDRVIVQSIGANPRRLPQSSKKNVSVLFFGPPGTAKTTVVKALADGLNWPLVFLSPGNFIERGLEYIEAQAKVVFDMLQRLSQVVVLFDECDELFRDRKPLPGTDQVRNITAFVTASMLPKLQDLHDRGRIVFAICTNHLESMDPAIKRGGRVDHLIGIGPPDRDARRKILEQTLADSLTIAHVSEGVDELASYTDRFTRVEIERAAASLLSKVYNSGLESRAAARRIANDMKPSLTISVEEFESFNRQKREFSYPHLVS